MPTTRLGRRTIKDLPPVTKPTVIYDAVLKGFGLAVRPTGAQRWIVEYRPAGGGRAAAKRRVTIGSPEAVSPEAAREHARDILARVALGEDPARDKASKRQAPRVEALYERFAREANATLKPSTRKLYAGYWLRHVKPALGNCIAGEVRRTEVARLHRSLGETTPVTANRVLALISAFFSWTIEAGELPDGFTNPASGIKRYREEGRERFLSNDELGRLGEAIREGETVGLPWPESASKHARKAENQRTILSPYEAAALRLLILTGARVSEVLKLRWQDVDMDRGILFLPDSKTGRKPVVLGVPALNVLAAVATLPKLGDYVIPGDVPGRPRGDYMKRPWAMVAKRAGLEGVRRHDLRHSFASVGAGGGLGLPVLGKLLGHASVQTTQRYSHLADGSLRRAANMISASLESAMGEASGATDRDP